MYYVAISIAIMSVVAYHYLFKRFPSSAHPILSLAVFYMVALLISLLSLSVVPPEKGLTNLLQDMNWTVVPIGLAIAGVELGILLSYRAGWSISVLPITITVTSTTTLAVLGVLVLQEGVSLALMLGLPIALAGIVLTLISKTPTHSRQGSDKDSRRRLYYFSATFTVASVVAYHYLISSFPIEANPIVSLVFFYLTALLVSLLGLLAFPLKKGLVESLKDLRWPVFLVGFAIAGMELGILLSYRVGWNLSVLPATLTVFSTVILAVLGLLLLREQISLRKAMGLTMALAGMLLVLQPSLRFAN